MTELKAIALVSQDPNGSVIRVTIAARYMSQHVRKELLNDSEYGVDRVSIHAIEETWSAATYHPAETADLDTKGGS